jgi:NAD-dependent deacetylase
MIDQSRRIVFFGGAGVSTESGLPDFRSEVGLYRQRYKYPPETMLSHSFFIAHPDEFYAFYRDKLLCPDVRPNAAHIKLAEMERAGRLTAVITQNIDGLHQMAGSQNVLELHGSVHRNYCMKCRRSCGIDYIVGSGGVPRCECGGIIRPDVVLYEETLDAVVMDAAVRSIGEADMLIVGGTSLAVYPAAGLINYYRGDRLVLINKSATAYDRSANLRIEASIGETLNSVRVSGI